MKEERIISVIKPIWLAVTVMLIFNGMAVAQQQPVVTQYTFNKYVLNPSAAGLEGLTSVSLFTRMQWAGLQNGPKTYSLNVDSRVLGHTPIFSRMSQRNHRIQKKGYGNTGWGAYIFNHSSGVLNRTGINGTYAYHLLLPDQKKVSFGISLLFFQLSIDGNAIDFGDEGGNQFDKVIHGGKQSLWSTDANFGISYSSPDFFIGYSTIQILNSYAQFGDVGTGEYQIQRQHYFMGGYKFYVNNILDFEPTFLFKLPETMNYQYDITAKFIIDKKVWTGLNYRMDNALAFFAGARYMNYNFSYAFEYNFNAIGRSTYASHELIVMARFGDIRRKNKWLDRSYNRTKQY